MAEAGPVTVVAAGILIPLCICVLVSVALVLLFRRELKRFFHDLVCSVVFHVWGIIDILRDFINRKRNVQESSAPPGEVAVVTGARGIGLEIIKKLLEKNVHVVIGCRDLSTGEKALEQIRAAGVKSGTASVYKLDLSSNSSVKSFAEEVLQFHPEIHILVNNAGAILKDRTLSKDGNELTFASNYLGHFYLTHLLLSRLVASARTRGIQARIVNMVSVAHFFPVIGKIHFEDLTLGSYYHQYLAYSQSKLAQSMFTKALDAKLRRLGIPVLVFAVHPGIVHTAIMTNFFAHRLLERLYSLIMRTAEEGARVAYYACANPDLEQKGGAYLYSCMETPMSKTARSEKQQLKLWTMTMELLDLKTFGDMLQ